MPNDQLELSVMSPLSASKSMTTAAWEKSKRDVSLLSENADFSGTEAKIVRRNSAKLSKPKLEVISRHLIYLKKLVSS